jgi:hypothetical protein
MEPGEHADSDEPDEDPGEGTEAFAIAAMPESMCFSPQAMSVKGRAAFKKPTAKAPQPVPRTCSTASCRPSRQTISGTSTALASTRRKNIIAAGSTSSTATLMKR